MNALRSTMLSLSLLAIALPQTTRAMRTLDDPGVAPTAEVVGPRAAAQAAAAVEAGVEWYAVEQDICPGDPFDSAAASAKFIRESLLG